MLIMKQFIENITHWHTSYYITLNFLLYFFITNGLEGTDTCVKILVNNNPTICHMRNTCIIVIFISFGYGIL